MAHTTRISLILRIRNADDADAWSQFVDIYGPLIYRYAGRKGLQDADAADLTQEVLGQVSKSIGRFDYDPGLGRFRNWLFAIARHTLNRRYGPKRRQPLGTGDTAVLVSLHALPGPDDDHEIWENEYRRHLFQWASEQIRNHFAQKTWAAFWQTAVEGRKPSDVARTLDMSIGAVYVAKNRVMTRLRRKIDTVDHSVEE